MNAAQKLPEPILFESLSTDQLREMARKTNDRTPWSMYDRAMLIAFHQNRHGKFVPQE